jgi:hypothetical protein
MKKSEVEELNKLFASIIKLFQSRCWICKGKYNLNESFVIHHKKYLVSDKIYSDFKKENSKGKLVPDKLSYYKYLIPIIKNDSKRFLLLHHKCHYSLGFICRFGEEKLKRLLLARKMSKK